MSEQQMSLVAKEEGMAIALSKHEGYQDWFRKHVEDMPDGWLFTSEDVTEAIGLPTRETEMNKNNSVGALMNGLAKTGTIANTGSRVKSKRVSSHGAELVVWQRTYVGSGKVGTQGQSAYPSPQSADLEARVRDADTVLAGLTTEAYETGDMAGFRRGYEQGIAAASKRPGAILEAKHEGVLAGRKQQAQRTMNLITNMREQMKGRGPVEAHTTTCWMKHPRCALDAVAKGQVIP